jgi:DNA repair exonuclease SbcCD nuclease subunit
VTIGGDLYEAEHVSPDTVEFLRKLFADVAPIQIFISPGNHDPFLRSSPYAYADWSDNVHVFREPQLFPVKLNDELTLWGAAHDSPSFTTDLLERFRLPNAGQAVLLLHATDRSLALGQYKGIYCPLSEQQVRAAGFGLALLGHIHHQRLTPASSPILCYPGSPEPLGFDEETGHSIVLAEWTGSEWRIDFRDISRWVYRTIGVDVTGFSSREDVISQIEQLWGERSESKHYLARIILGGQPDASFDFNDAALRESLRDFVEDVTIIDNTSLPFDLITLSGESTVVGTFVRHMVQQLEEAKRQGDERKQHIIEKAIAYGLTALENREIRSL